MGCFNSRSRKVTKLTQVPTQRNSSESENLFFKESLILKKISLVTSHAFSSKDTPNPAEIKSGGEPLSQGQNSDLLKEGEDSEAKVIFKGKDKSESIETSEVKRAVSRKLPPLARKTCAHNNFNISMMAEVKPNLSLINDLLSKEKMYDFDDISIEDSKDEDHDETILSILNELKEVN